MDMLESRDMTVRWPSLSITSDVVVGSCDLLFNELLCYAVCWLAHYWVISLLYGHYHRRALVAEYACQLSLPLHHLYPSYATPKVLCLWYEGWIFSWVWGFTMRILKYDVIFLKIAKLFRHHVPR